MPKWIILEVTKVLFEGERLHAVRHFSEELVSGDLRTVMIYPSSSEPDFFHAFKVRKIALCRYLLTCSILTVGVTRFRMSAVALRWQLLLYS